MWMVALPSSRTSGSLSPPCVRGSFGRSSAQHLGPATRPRHQLADSSACFREIQDEELRRFCSRVSSLLQKEAWGPDAVDALRRLFLIVSATKYARKLEKTCVDLLQTTLCRPMCPEPLQLLCAAILREMSPCDSLSLSCDHVQSTRQLSLVASVLLAQVT
ncbi:PREDICTED: AP-5 complex subunit zeta-1-like isoform X2 [Miniopterus natalensis]|uniref:AP-5 complex subunit zeta-1-like isoform X1 n=1 Tax=Miniopterus natalensis TaxID=291302 RepID=UPI0007A724B5|nr:PREDICTED: AP-5 complex subunit zeta-1-like isoform X1 [Miniopterus natalensis]XP_016069146.1 PREDICTED: AP-5 complex subunit zeta-1-like isoform X2 [Miniopterus natalensis]